MSPKAVLVTGCAGFIGSNFVRQFKKEFPKIKIIGIDDFSTGRKEVIDALRRAQGIKNFIFYKGSILDKELLEKIFKNR